MSDLYSKDEVNQPDNEELIETFDPVLNTDMTMPIKERRGKRGRPPQKKEFRDRKVRFIAELPRHIITVLDDWCDDMHQSRSAFVREAIYARMQFYGLHKHIPQFDQSRVDTTCLEPDESREIDHSSWVTDEGTDGDDLVH